MGAPAIFEKQIEIKLLHSASTLESRIQEIIKFFIQVVMSKYPFHYRSSIHRDCMLVNDQPLEVAGNKRNDHLMLVLI
ncbi:MAG: hypothetical protein P8X79_13945 [Reinekea sp.]